MKLKALVTGAAGFMGSHLCEELLGRGIDVIAVDNLSGGLQANLPGNKSIAAFYRTDVTNYRELEKVFAEVRPDYVYHLAAYAAEGLSHNIRGYNYLNNVVGSANVVSCCIKHYVRCLVYTSSIAVYGAGQVPFSEFNTPHPEDPYGLAKLTVEKELALAWIRHGLQYVIFRPHNVYGPRQNIADPFRNVVGIFMRQLLEGQPLTIFGDGSQTRAFTYVTDIIPTIARAPLVEEAYGKAFNLGADNVWSVANLAEVLCRVAGKPLNVNHLPARDEVVNACSDHSLTRAYFGPSISTNLGDGLAKMWDWAINTPIPSPTPCPAPLEYDERLPASWRKHFNLCT